jgi:geranylgeranyl reductase family protein
MNSHPRIAIIGAGPSGSTCSFFLSRFQIPHVLIDAAEFPRDKVCGDAISGKALHILRKMDPQAGSNLQGKAGFTDTWGISFTAPNEKRLDIPFKKEKKEDDLPVGFVSKRLDFDHYLFQKTQSPLAQIRTNTSLVGIQKSSTGVLLELKKDELRETLEVDWVIGAEGERSLVAKFLAGYRKEPRHFSAGIRQYWKGVTKCHSENYIELHFLKDLLPGYFWIFPMSDGTCNVGLGMRSDRVSQGKVNLKKELDRIIQEHPQFKERFQHAEALEMPKGWGLPMGSKQQTIAGDGFLLLGDAAALIDPFTGEGIGNGMKSGWMAAELIQECWNNGSWESLPQKYQQRVFRSLGDELRVSDFLQRSLDFPWLFNAVVRKANKSPLLKETLICMFEDVNLRQQLRKPKFYWDLLVK